MRMNIHRQLWTVIYAAAVLPCAAAESYAEEAITIQLSVQNRQFQPSEIRAPAGKRIILRIKNNDVAPAEFESVSLRVEKVIAGKSEGVINLRPLQPGRYKFFDDFNPSAQGALVVE